MEPDKQNNARYGMAIDLDRCNGCGTCMVACAIENNVPPAQPQATKRTGITPMQVFEVRNDRGFPFSEAVFVPMPCQQCEKDTPCVTVCPQNAVEVDAATGIVGQVPQRCLGCRYCMTACPYHARYFNWWDPKWPAGMEKALNPDVAPRMRGVVEKCNFCHGRLHSAKAKAAAEGKRQIHPDDYIPACAENCPAQAIVFGDLGDPSSEVARLAAQERSFRFLTRLGTEPKVYYHSEKAWVKQLAEKSAGRAKKEAIHG